MFWSPSHDLMALCSWDNFSEEAPGTWSVVAVFYCLLLHFASHTNIVQMQLYFPFSSIGWSQGEAGAAGPAEREKYV